MSRRPHTKAINKVNSLKPENKAKSSKQQKTVDLEDISFFSLEELPDLYEFFLLKIIMNRCLFKVASETLLVGIEGKGVYLEQKKFKAGGESTINLEAIQANLEDLNSKENELVCYGKVEEHDLVTLFARKEHSKNTLIGKIQRINVASR